MTLTKQRIDAVRRVLGPNDRWALVHARGATQVQRWTWKCGCLLDCTGTGRNGHEMGFQWDRCGSHILVLAPA